MNSLCSFRYSLLSSICFFKLFKFQIEPSKYVIPIEIDSEDDESPLNIKEENARIDLENKEILDNYNNKLVDYDVSTSSLHQNNDVCP